MKPGDFVYCRELFSKKDEGKLAVFIEYLESTERYEWCMIF